MIRGLAACAILAVALSGCSFGEASGAADQAVEKFHAQFEAEDYAAMYTGADPQFRGATAAKDWTDLMAAVRRKLGHFRSASRGNVNVTQSTGGTFVAQSFDTTYDEGHATEQFRWRVADGHAFLLGYNISSPILITR